MFLNFVINSKLRLNSNKLKWFVMGKEPSDLASVVCCLTYAYYKQDKFGTEFDYIPVCCISKDNLQLMKEINDWLELFGINSFQELVLFDDVKNLMNNRQSVQLYKFSLLDHQEPQLPIITDYVREVIDHHESVFNYSKGQLEVNNVHFVGSCCTLISKYILERSELRDRGIVLEMLRDVILWDTECLDKNNRKTTIIDVNIVEVIENELGIESYTRSDIYNLLLKFKSDISELSLRMMIQKDHMILELPWKKSFLKMAIPILVNVDIKEILNIRNLESKLTEVVKSLMVDIIIGFTCGPSSKQQRGYFIFSHNSEVNYTISEYLLLSDNNLNIHPLTQSIYLRSFYQDDLLTSRKIFIPIIQKLFNEKRQFCYEQKNNCSFNIRRALELSNNAKDQENKSHLRKIQMTAYFLVRNVLKESINIIVDEMNMNVVIKDWSDHISKENRNEILVSFKSNNLRQLAYLLTSFIIQDCLKSEDMFISQMQNSVNNCTITKDEVDFQDNDSSSTSESILSNEDMNYHDCHLGQIINEENQNVPSNFVNFSSAYVVENSSFNLYRRISNNQINFSLDEKELLATVCNCTSEEEDIFRNSEFNNGHNYYDEPNQSFYQSHLDLHNNDVVKKVIFPDKDFYLDTLNFDTNADLDLSTNDLDNMSTPHLQFIEELELTESSDLLFLNCSEKYLQNYKIAINCAGCYFDALNNNELTKLITISSGDFPDKTEENYKQIMQYIFDYALNILDSRDTKFYSIVYFHYSKNQLKTPSLLWLHRNYKSITYKIKKNMKHLYIVYPTLWVRTALFFSRFFINSKFYLKIQYISKLEDLNKYVPTSHIRFPPDNSR